MSLVTSWNMNGVSWKGFSAVEILWVAHTNTIETLKADKPQQVRMYLTQTKDYTTLREWDNSQIKDSSDN